MLILRKAGKMKKTSCNLKKKNFYTYLMLFLILTIILSFTVDASSFVPYPPDGTTKGDKNIEYEYTINTVEVGSSWMFDWGDGTYSDWIVLGKSDPFISQNHSWTEYGEYQVRVKYKGPYSSESPWSPPLIVNISQPKDIDKDGWTNIVEESYGTDPRNSSSHPLDTDNDGLPDECSIDGKFIGDTDDDADGLEDAIEISLGSNPKNNHDVETIFVENRLFYIVDTDNDGYGNILFNLETNSKTKIKNQDGLLYLDIDSDGSWDYTYDGELLVYTPFPWLQLIIGIVGVILIILVILFKTGIIYIYEEEVVEK